MSSSKNQNNQLKDAKMLHKAEGELHSRVIILFILRSVVLFLRYLSICPLFQSCSHSQGIKLCRGGSLCADRCAEEHDSKQIATFKVLEQQLRHISLKSSFDWWL